MDCEKEFCDKIKNDDVQINYVDLKTEKVSFPNPDWDLAAATPTDSGFVWDLGYYPLSHIQN